MQQDNVAEIDPTVLPNSLPDGTTAYRVVSGVKTRGAAIETSGELTEGWNVTRRLYLHLQQGRQGQSGAHGQSAAHVQAYSTYKLGRWTLGGGVDWKTKVYQNMNAPTGRFTGAGAPILAATPVTQGRYILVDALLRYAVNDKISIGVNATNLFDERYYRTVGYSNGGYRGEPRRALFNARTRY